MGAGPTREGILRLWDPELRRCAQCWGPVDLAAQWDGSWALVCPKGCEPGGHVSEIHVRYEQMRMQEECRQVARNYPDLARAAGIRVPTKLETAADALFLFGGDADLQQWTRTNHPGRVDPVRVSPEPRKVWRPRVRPFHRSRQRRTCLG